MSQIESRSFVDVVLDLETEANEYVREALEFIKGESRHTPAPTHGHGWGIGLGGTRRQEVQQLRARHHLLLKVF